MSGRAAGRLVGGLAIVALVAAWLPSLGRGMLRYWEQNPVLRGQALAQDLGCLGCHDPVGGGEIPNPDSRWGSVPRFGVGNAMMYVEGRRDVEEIIRFGAPRAWLDDPDVAIRLDTQLIRMPAYGHLLSNRQIDDLVAWSMAVEGIDLPGDERAAEGRRLAKKHGCLSCHGVEGAGGVANPGSLGGFIPGFRGSNFVDLVQDEAEFREWVLDGTSSRLGELSVARFFWRAQALQMPAYRQRLGEEEISRLWSWVQAIRAPRPAAP